MPLHPDGPDDRPDAAGARRARRAVPVTATFARCALVAGLAVGAAALIPAATPAKATGLDRSGNWSAIVGEAPAEERPVTFRSSSPFLPRDVGPTAPPTTAVAAYYPPIPAAGVALGSDDAAAPAVILLHGAGGVSRSREHVYARQFAAQGVGVLVIDVFAARRAVARGFIERILSITETMALADAYAGLAWLAARPEIDPDRIALIGFSYGGIASLAAVHEQTARLFAPDGPRFAAHVAFYGPCIARYDDVTTTGAPVLMLWGGRDEIMDAQACATVADDLVAGGSDVETIVYPDALHRWDGGNRAPWRASRHVADCRFEVDPDGGVREATTGLVMTNPITRRLILAACSSEDGYLIGSDEAVRLRSNAALARFLGPVLFPPDDPTPGMSPAAPPD